MNVEPESEFEVNDINMSIVNSNEADTTHLFDDLNPMVIATVSYGPLHYFCEYSKVVLLILIIISFVSIIIKKMIFKAKKKDATEKSNKSLKRSWIFLLVFVSLFIVLKIWNYYDAYDFIEEYSNHSLLFEIPCLVTFLVSLAKMIVCNIKRKNNPDLNDNYSIIKKYLIISGVSFLLCFSFKYLIRILGSNIDSLGWSARDDYMPIWLNRVIIADLFMLALSFITLYFGENKQRKITNDNGENQKKVIKYDVITSVSYIMIAHSIIYLLIYARASFL